MVASLQAWVLGQQLAAALLAWALTLRWA